MRILTGELRISPNYSRKYSPGGKRNLLLSKGCFLVVVESSARRPPSRGRRTGPSPTSRDTTPTSRDDRTSTSRDDYTTSRDKQNFHNNTPGLYDGRAGPLVEPDLCFPAEPGPLVEPGLQRSSRAFTSRAGT
jgi:hypothetical protein